MSAADTALRMALVQMLSDTTFAIQHEEAGWVRSRLRRNAWNASDRARLTVWAELWAERQPESVRLAIRRALGQEIARDPVPRNTSAPASADTPARAPVAQTQGDSQMPSIAESPAETTVMPPEFDEAKLAHVVKMMQAPDQPYWFPHDTKRLAQAEKLYREGRVTLDRFGIFHVKSRTKKDLIYDIDRECPCKAAEKGRTKWCAHLVSTVIYRKMHAPLSEETPMLFPPSPTIDERIAGNAPSSHEETSMPEEVLEDEFYTETAPGPRETPQTANSPVVPYTLQHSPVAITHSGAVMHEAPYCFNTTVENAAGFQGQFTIRAQDEAEFFRKVRGLLARFKEAGMTPVKRPQPRAGVVQGEPSPQGNASTGSPVCEWHGPMKESTKAPGTWYCTKKMASGEYCKERFPK